MSEIRYSKIHWLYLEIMLTFISGFGVAISFVVHFICDSLYESRMIEVGFVENEILDLNKSIKWEIIYIHIICCLVCVRFSIFSGINFKYLILILFNKCFYKDLTDFGFGFYYILFYYCFQNGIEQIVVTINVSFLFH